MEKVVIGSDHGGYSLKEELKPFIRSLGFQLVDIGCYNTDSVDYPDFAFLVADAVSRDPLNCRGIMIDGAGIASAMVGNKISGIRAALAWDLYTANNAREHNNANMLTLGSMVTGPGLAKEIVKIFLTTPFAGGRHKRRVDKLDAIDLEFRRRR